MAVIKRVRVICTYEVDVSAEYGDTVQTLIDRAVADVAGLDPAPERVDAVLVPDADGDPITAQQPQGDPDPTPEV